MKRYCKFFSFIGLLGLILALTGVSAIGASEGTPAVRIMHHNLAFGNEIYLLYAVETENTGGAAPFMEFRVGNDDFSTPDTVYQPDEYRPLDEGDTQSCYYIFAFRGLNAAQMADEVYARAGVTVNGTTYYSEKDSYSVCEYAARKLGIVGDATETKDENLQALLLSMLKYGSDAQRYLDYNTDCLAEDYYLTFANNETPTAGVKYNVKDDGTAEVVIGYDGNDTKVVIATKDPETGAKVTSIAKGAFKNNAIINEVIVPSTVETIGAGAFENCDNLTRVELREGVKVIGEKAFAQCGSLTELVLPASLTTLGTAMLPDSTDITLRYNGTETQLRALLAKNTTWGTEYCTYTFTLSNGTKIEYPFE